ncbi:MAG: hypothetical protein AAF502_25180 [Bacteroidota bacterium]
MNKKTRSSIMIGIEGTIVAIIAAYFHSDSANLWLVALIMLPLCILASFGFSWMFNRIK